MKKTRILLDGKITSVIENADTEADDFYSLTPEALEVSLPEKSARQLSLKPSIPNFSVISSLVSTVNSSLCTFKRLQKTQNRKISWANGNRTEGTEEHNGVPMKPRKSNANGGVAKRTSVVGRVISAPPIHASIGIFHSNIFRGDLLFQRRDVVQSGWIQA